MVGGDAKGGSDSAQGGSAPGWTPEIGERIEKAVQRAGGYPRAAKIADTKAEQIRKWRNGSARPPLFGMAAIAVAAGVSLDWLISGSHTGTAQQQSQAQINPQSAINEVVAPDYSVASQEHIDQEILPRVVDAVARAYRIEGISISVMDLVRIGSDYLRDVIQAFSKAHTPLTIDAIIPVAWLLTTWVQRDLRKPVATQDQTKREASGS